MARLRRSACEGGVKETRVIAFRAHRVSLRRCDDAPLAASAPRSALVPPLDQGTMAYTYANGVLAPYCLLSPLAGNHDSSYATAVRTGDEMWVVFHLSLIHI